MKKNSILIFMSLTILLSSNVFAQDKTQNKGKKNTGGAERVDVNIIKKKYWAKGDQAELGVVQNRIYTKNKKFQIGLLAGISYSDPFLSIKTGGFTFGYHFNEFWGVNLIAMKTVVSNSSALTTFEENRGATANTNKPRYFVGAETTFSLLYGKLSVLGKSIIYYDFHLIGGLGLTDTESGKYMTPMAGLGQRFYLSRRISLRVDYRLMYYKETILEKEITTKLGQAVGDRGNFTNSITLGIDYLF